MHDKRAGVFGSLASGASGLLRSGASLLGHGALGVGRLAAAPAFGVANVASAGGRGLFRSGLETVMRSGREAPFGTAMAIGMAPLALSGNPFRAENVQMASLQAGRNAASFGNSYKVAQMLFDPAELDALVEMKKQISPRQKTASAQGDALEQILKRLEAIEKVPARTAPKPLGAEDILRAAGIMGGTGIAVGLGQQAINLGVNKAREKLHEAGRGERFGKVLRIDPSLASEPRARQMFNILDRTSPAITDEPLVASATIHSMLATPPVSEKSTIPNVGARFMKEILEAQKLHEGTRARLSDKPHIGGEVKADIVRGMMG